MPQYVLLKHYRGAPPMANDIPMSEWTADEVNAHVDYMNALADRLRASGEFVDARALSPDAEFVSADSGGRPVVHPDPVPESKALLAGGMLIDVASRERALEVAAELAAAPGAGGRPCGEWLELRALYGGDDDEPIS